MNSKFTCIYTQPRTGSCFLTKCFETDFRYFNIEEAFSPVNVWGITRIMTCVADLIRINYEKKQREKNIKFTFFLDSVCDYLRSGNFDASVNNHVLCELKKITQTNFIFKLFHHHIKASKVDVQQLFVDSNSNGCIVDNLILNYRKNNLLRWISEKRAFATNKWIKFNDQKTDDSKIIWNKKEYLEDFEKKESECKEMLENYKNFRGSKVIICYENMHKNKENKIIKLKKILASKNINININIKNSDLLPRIQSDQTINIEDNFENKLEFLKDYDSIKNKIKIKVFDLWKKI